MKNNNITFDSKPVNAHRNPSPMNLDQTLNPKARLEYVTFNSCITHSEIRIFSSFKTSCQKVMFEEGWLLGKREEREVNGRFPIYFCYFVRLYL